MKDFLRGLKIGLIYSLICVACSATITYSYFKVTDYFEAERQKELQVQELIKSQQSAIQQSQEEQKKLQEQMAQDKIDTQAKIDAERKASQIAQANLKKQIEARPTTVIQNNTIIGSEIDTSAIVREWRPQVGYILCDFGSYYASGSGLLRTYTGGRYIIQTNRHVMYAVVRCAVRFPGNPEIFTIENDATGLMRISSSGQDWGFMYLPYNAQISNTRLGQNCSSSASVGDKIIIIGYPGVGATGDVTVTEGIISGYEGDYYITSAKIEHGNSGGAAIDLKRNCYLGIPTSSVVGSVESLGRILDINKMR